jgi:hypothetical protein
MRKLKLLVASATLLTLAPSAALAKNYCISGFPNKSYSLVGQGFTLPAKGKCKAWIGFNPEGGNWPTTGTGCTSSDGSNFSLTVTTGAESAGESAGFAEIDAITLDLPAQTGQVVGQEIVNSTVTTFGPSNGIVGEVCSTNTIPAAATAQEGAALLPGDGSVPKP